jgi:hypothetical protein
MKFMNLLVHKNFSVHLNIVQRIMIDSSFSSLGWSSAKGMCSSLSAHN